MLCFAQGPDWEHVENKVTRCATSSLTSSQGSLPCLLPLHPHPGPQIQSSALPSSTEGEGDITRELGEWPLVETGVWEQCRHLNLPLSSDHVTVKIREVSNSTCQEGGLMLTLQRVHWASGVVVGCFRGGMVLGLGAI